MAAGPATRVTDVVVPEIFTPYVQQLTDQKARIIQSGLAVRDPAIDLLLAGGGLTFNVPSFRDLDDDAERVARVHIDDDRCAEPCAINELVGDEIHRRRMIWTLRDMALASRNDYFPVRGRWPRA